MPVLNQPVVAYAIADRIAAGAHEIAFAPTPGEPPGRCVTTSPKTRRPSSPRGASTPSMPCSPTCTTRPTSRFSNSPGRPLPHGIARHARRRFHRGRRLPPDGQRRTAATPRRRRCPSRSRDTRRARLRHRSRHRRPPLRRPGPLGGGKPTARVHAAYAAVKSGTLALMATSGRAPEQAGTRRPHCRRESRPRPRPAGQVSTRLRRRPATARPMPRSSRTAPPAAIQATGAPVIGRPPPLPPSELLLATVTAAVTA